MRAAVLLALLLGCSKADTVEVRLTAACSQPDAGASTPCASYRDLGCVNFLRFFVLVDGQERSRCVPVRELLGGRPGSFCDFEQQMSRGLELFDLRPDQRVRLFVQGLRIFPVTDCQGDRSCERAPIFRGQSEERRVDELIGTSIPIVVDECNACGPAEEFFPNPEQRDCRQVCQERVVCATLGGCLCRGAS